MNFLDINQQDTSKDPAFLNEKSHNRNETQQKILKTGYALIASRGFSDVSLSEIARAAGVPKSSFYYYFSSKEAFGETLIRSYFKRYLVEMQQILLLNETDSDDNKNDRSNLEKATKNKHKSNSRERILAFFHEWTVLQSSDSPLMHCPIVKLAGEVSDLSDAMRAALLESYQDIIHAIEMAIVAGQNDGSISQLHHASQTAQSLYHLWLGASLADKLTQNNTPLKNAMQATLLLI